MHSEHLSSVDCFSMFCSRSVLAANNNGSRNGHFEKCFPVLLSLRRRIVPRGGWPEVIFRKRARVRRVRKTASVFVIASTIYVQFSSVNSGSGRNDATAIISTTTLARNDGRVVTNRNSGVEDMDDRKHGAPSVWRDSSENVVH